MQLKNLELASHLGSTLSSSYLFHGAEPLLIEDSLSLIRKASQQQGFEERLVFTMETGFDWSKFSSEFDSLSLFSQKKLIELRMPTGKPGVKGAEIIADIVNQKLDDTILVVICPKLETGAKNSKWVKQFNRDAVNVEHYTIAANQLVGWINQRARQYQLKIDADACRLLAYYLEGNLLAIDQELKKFSLFDRQRTILIEDIEKGVEDSARFNLYSFVDTALAGQFKRAMRMLGSLKTEGTEPVLINWALSRETRQLVEMASEIDNGSSISAVLKSHRIWRNRAGIVGSTLKRLKLPQLQAVHQRLAYLDRMIKGRASTTMKADIWTEYEQIIMCLC